MAQWVKCPALPQLWHRSQVWLGFKPWPPNFPKLWVWPKKGEKKATPEQLHPNDFIGI